MKRFAALFGSSFWVFLLDNKTRKKQKRNTGSGKSTRSKAGKGSRSAKGGKGKENGYPAGGGGGEDDEEEQEDDEEERHSGGQDDGIVAGGGGFDQAGAAGGGQEDQVPRGTPSARRTAFFLLVLTCSLFRWQVLPVFSLRPLFCGPTLLALS